MLLDDATPAILPVRHTVLVCSYLGIEPLHDKRDKLCCRRRRSHGDVAVSMNTLCATGLLRGSHQSSAWSSLICSPHMPIPISAMFGVQSAMTSFQFTKCSQDQSAAEAAEFTTNIRFSYLSNPDDHEEIK